MSDPSPRDALLESLLVERFTPYRAPVTSQATPEEVARALRLIVDNEHRDAS